MVLNLWGKWWCSVNNHTTLTLACRLPCPHFIPCLSGNANIELGPPNVQMVERIGNHNTDFYKVSSFAEENLTPFKVKA